MWLKEISRVHVEAEMSAHERTASRRYTGPAL